MQIASKIIKTLNKGQITIPNVLRKKLGIKQDSYLRVYLEGKKLILEPLEFGIQKVNLEKYVRTFSDEEIREFLELDKIDTKILQKAKKLLK